MNREQWQVKQHRYQTHPLAGDSAPAASRQTLAARAGPPRSGPHPPAPARRPLDTAFPA